MSDGGHTHLDPTMLEPARARPLDPALRAEFERTFDASFADVRIHDDPAAGASADALHAQAYTYGSDIVFGRGAYRPGTPDGRHVLAHELAHVVQQRGGVEGPAQSGGLEADADQAAAAATAGHAATVSGSAGVGVARTDKNNAGATPSPLAVPEPRYEYVDEDGTTRQVSADELDELRRQAMARVRTQLRKVERDAAVHRAMHEDFINLHGSTESWGDIWADPSALVLAAIDWRAGVVPPDIAIWTDAGRWATDGEQVLNAGDLHEAALFLQAADNSHQDAVREWNAYMDAIRESSQKLLGEVGVVRDVSFAISITAAVILAAPAVAAGVTATGATGLTATGATAAGTGLVGAGTGAVLRGGAEAATQQVAYGKVDASSVVAEGKRGAREGLIAGATAGLAPGLANAVGVGTEGLTIWQQLARRAAFEGTTNAVGQGADAALQGKSAGEVLKAVAVGAGTGAATAPFGVGGANLAQGGRELLSQGVEVGGSGVVAGGVTLLSGGTWEEAALNSGIAIASSGALAAAPAPGPGKPVSKESTTEDASVTAKPTVTDDTPAATKPAATEEPPVTAKPPANEEASVTAKPPVAPITVAPDRATASTTNAAPDAPKAPATEAALVAPETDPPDVLKGPAAAPEGPAAAIANPSQATVATSTPAGAAPAPATHERITAQEDVVKGKLAEIRAAEVRAGVAPAATSTESELIATYNLFRNAEVRQAQAKANARTTAIALMRARRGSKMHPLKENAAAQNELRAAESALWRARQVYLRHQELAASERELERVKRSVENPDEAPRQKRGEPFDPKKRRPLLSSWANDIDLPGPAGGKGFERHDGSGRKTAARVSVFKQEVSEKLRAQHDALVADLKAHPERAKELGHVYERLLSKDLTPNGPGLRWHSHEGDKLRTSDHGIHEFTVEAELSDRKLDQIWRDLQRDFGAGPCNEAVITVPQLSNSSARRLAKLAAAYEELTGREPLITVRETIL